MEDQQLETKQLIQTDQLILPVRIGVITDCLDSLLEAGDHRLQIGIR